MRTAKIHLRVRKLSFGEYQTILPIVHALKNWLSVSIAYLKATLWGGEMRPVSLVFRGNNTPVVCVNISQLRTVLRAIHIASILGTNPVVRADRVRTITGELDRLLSREYSAEEIRRGVTGGRPGLLGVFIYFLVQEIRPEVVVETGVAQGVSTRFMLEAMHELGSGRLISIDLPTRREGQGGGGSDTILQDPVNLKGHLLPGWLVGPELRNRWTLHLGRSDEVLPRITEVVDLFLHDSSHEYKNMLQEFDWAFSHLKPGGILVSDDVDWNRAFRDFAKVRGNGICVLSDRVLGVAIKM
jgi:predicted O-methyltransferase YrrM